MELETHGGLNYTELRAMGIDPSSLIDFSTNVNPFGPAPHVAAALRAIDPSAYPDRDALDLRTALAYANGVPLDNVMAGNGTAELIWLIAHAFLKAGDRVLVVGPTFSEYERAACASGAGVVLFQAMPPLFALDVDELVARITKDRPRLVFLCNPNNPTGVHLADADVRRIAAACAEGFLILDEAYRSFVTSSPFGPPPSANTLVLRSMTKDFALAGLRLGYALGAAHFLQAMRSIQPPWSVSSVAQAAGLACLGDLDYLQCTLERTRQSALALRSALSSAGANVLPGATHYLLIDVGQAASWRKQLLTAGCLVRDCSSFGLISYLRVSTRGYDKNQHLIKSWPKGL